MPDGKLESSNFAITVGLLAWRCTRAASPSANPATSWRWEALNSVSQLVPMTSPRSSWGGNRARTVYMAMFHRTQGSSAEDTLQNDPAGW